LLNFEKKWKESPETGDVIFSNEFERYNILIENFSEGVNDINARLYEINQDSVITSSSGNPYVYTSNCISQLELLKIYLEHKYELIPAEISMIKDDQLKDQYSLYLTRRTKVEAKKISQHIMTLIEDNLRSLNGDVVSEMWGVKLVDRVLNPAHGTHHIAECNDTEKEGFYNFVKGYFNFTRGRPSHGGVEVSRGELFRQIMIADKIIIEFKKLTKK